MKIGVGGASGHLGKAIIKYLKERGVPASDIVAITRTPETADGVEARFGDYNDRASLVKAYAGLDRLVLIPGMDFGPGERARQTTGAIDAALEAGVGYIYYVSSVTVPHIGPEGAPDSDSRTSYWKTEQALTARAPKWTVLRMAYYQESIVDEARQMLGMGMMTGLGDTPVNFVSRDDLAASVAAALATDGHEGKIYTITGPRTYTGTERVAAISPAAGKDIAFAVISEEQLQGGLRQFQLPEDIVTIVTSIQQGFARGDYDVVTDDVAKLTGRQPRTLEQTARDMFSA